MTLGLEDFEGRWRIARVMEGDLGGGPASLHGEARFAPVDTGLRYVEEGDLVVGARRMTARQEALWQIRRDEIHVSFADGRPFHAFDRTATRPSAHHDCPPDLYLVQYDFASWPLWVTEWRVRGPRKDYRVRTEYRREGTVS